MSVATKMRGAALAAALAALLAALALAAAPAQALAAGGELAAGGAVSAQAGGSQDEADDAEQPAEQAFVKSTAKLKVDKSKGWLVENGTYYIALASDATKVLGAGGKVQGKTGAKRQAWKVKFDYNSQCYTITNARTGKALTVKKSAKKGSKLYEAKLVKKSQHLTALRAIPAFNVPVPNQRWILKSTKNGYYFASAANPKMVVDLGGGHAVLAKKTSRAAKKTRYFWFVGREGTYADNGIGEGTYTLRSASKGTLLNIKKSSVKKGAKARLGKALTLWGQMFQLEHVKNGWYRVKSFNSGMALTARAGKVYQYKAKPSLKAYQLWKPVVVGEDGAVQLLSKKTGKALAAKGSGVALSASDPSDADQRWLVSPTTTGLTTVGQKALYRANKYKSKTKYAIVIDMTAHEYFLFKKAKSSKKGAPWKLDRTSRCSTGKRGAMTNASVNTLGHRAAPPTGRVSGVPAKYCYWAGGSGWLHSIVTYGPQGNNQLGWYVSNGCIRLPYDEAEYIYKLNISGTRFIRYYV